MKGYLEQEETPTPDNPVEIKTQVIGKNLFETYEVNDRKYTDNLPKNSFINIPKKQYIEYEQQKEEIERLQKILRTKTRLHRKHKAKVRKLREEITNKQKRLELLHSIIKEAKEYLPKLRRSTSYELDEKIDDLEEILDKVGKAKNLIGKKVKITYGKRVGLYSTGKCHEAPVDTIELFEEK